MFLIPRFYIHTGMVTNLKMQTNLSSNPDTLLASTSIKTYLFFQTPSLLHLLLPLSTQPHLATLCHHPQLLPFRWWKSSCCLVSSNFYFFFSPFNAPWGLQALLRWVQLLFLPIFRVFNYSLFQIFFLSLVTYDFL